MIATVVLAAGRSERFGSPKLLAEWWGRPLVERALEIAPPGLKVAVVGIAAAIGGYNHFVVVPALERTDDADAMVGRARSTVSVEAVVLVVVVAVTVFLTTASTN